MVESLSHPLNDLERSITLAQIPGGMCPKAPLSPEDRRAQLLGDFERSLDAVAATDEELDHFYTTNYPDFLGVEAA